jgi:hypothetical protein
MFNGAVSLVYVVYGAVAKALGEYIVLPFGNITASHANRFERSVKTVACAPALLNALMISKILTIID